MTVYMYAYNVLLTNTCNMYEIKILLLLYVYGLYVCSCGSYVSPFCVYFVCFTCTYIHALVCLFTYISIKQPTYEGVRLGLGGVCGSSVATMILALGEYVSKVTRPIDRNILINMVPRLYLNSSPDLFLYVTID